MAGASLNLYDKNNVSIYGGIANSSGKAKFDVSFVDGNYTDNLRLEASKGNWSVAVDMTLLSDTPLILRLQCDSDLNADGKMDIQDITIIAIAYQTKPGDDKWNELADVDKNGMVNIIDVALVAKDFGETV